METLYLNIFYVLTFHLLYLHLHLHLLHLMHLTLLLIGSSLSGHHPTPSVTLHPPPPKKKQAECKCFHTDIEGVGGGRGVERVEAAVSRVSPLCNSMHYMLSLPSVCVQHLMRSF